MKQFPTICPRCNGSGTHQRGLCFQCKGEQVIMQKTSKTMKTFKHGISIDGVRRSLVTWGRNMNEAKKCAEIILLKHGLI